MTWTINLMYLVLLTSATGSILFGFWYGVGRVLEVAGFVDVVYELLKAVLIFWYFPLAFLVVQRMDFFHLMEWGGFLGKITPLLEDFSKLFCLVWFVGFGLNLGCYLTKLRRLHRNYRNAIFCDGWMYDCFEEVCEELRIPAGRVELAEDAHDDIPKIIGIVHPKVVIPLQEYTEDELRVIFTHELMHYRQKILWVKHLTAVAGAIHFFNPCMRILTRKVDYWGEHVCDYESIAAVGNMKAYFTVIAAMELTSQKGGETHVADDAKGK
jgi:hypothetical protein